METEKYRSSFIVLVLPICFTQRTSMKSLSALENAHQLSQSPSHQTSHFSQSHNRSYLSISLASFRLSHESLSHSQRTPLNHSQLSQIFSDNKHMRKIERKKNPYKMSQWWRCRTCKRWPPGNHSWDF